MGAPGSVDPCTYQVPLVTVGRRSPIGWSDPESASEALAVLNDPEAVADLREAEHDTATGNHCSP